jgi:hypothetical protein
MYMYIRHVHDCAFLCMCMFQFVIVCAVLTHRPCEVLCRAIGHRPRRILLTSRNVTRNEAGAHRHSQRERQLECPRRALPLAAGSGPSAAQRVTPDRTNVRRRARRSSYTDRRTVRGILRIARAALGHSPSYRYMLVICVPSTRTCVSTVTACLQAEALPWIARSGVPSRARGWEAAP